MWTTVFFIRVLFSSLFSPYLLGAVCHCWRTRARMYMPTTDHSMPPLRTAERVGDATARAAVALREAIHAAERRPVGPVRVAALDACLLDALLIDFWHRWRHHGGVRPTAHTQAAVSAA